jgi:hypothetical protein
MKKCLSYLIVAALVFPLGCAREPDPRERPDFVDTSDPSKVLDTMKPPPGQGGGGASAGAGPPPSAGS